jgi:protein-tyrosine phosphatase
MFDQRLLFLCTGNYYRSRFAHELWSHLERATPTGWRAESGALSLAATGGNLGAMSPHALRALEVRGIQLTDRGRMPRLAEKADFALSERIVAMSGREHRPMIASRFPDWVDAVEYWDVEDMDVCPPELALPRIESRVHELRSRIKPVRHACGLART